jgi:hypothetical protein
VGEALHVLILDVLMCRANGMRRSAQLVRAAANGAGCADQARDRGGWSGGEWPRLSGQPSFRGGKIVTDVANTGWKTAADIPVKHWVIQHDMNTHLSQSTGAFDGQHGMPFAIASAVAEMDISSAISSAIADIDASEFVPAMTGRDNGARTSPAIMKIASRRRMVIWRFTATKSHKTARIDSLPGLTTP